MTTQIPSEGYAPTALDRTRTAANGGYFGIALIVVLVVIGAGVVLMWSGREYGEPYLLILLAVLAMAGIGLLFAVAAGILRVLPKGGASPIVKALVDEASESILVTDADGRVLYANASYLELTGAADANEVRPIERAFMGDAQISEVVYRLLKAAREGRQQEEEVRVAGHKGDAARWLRLRIRPLGVAKHDRRTVAWAVADVTRERDRQENVFQELQHAIDYLDHAPAGFLSVDAAGRVIYVNATLATWLGYDLAQIGSGGLKLDDIVPGDGAALFTSLTADSDEVKTEVFDIDFKTRNGRRLPVRLFHKVTFGADRMPAPSRTLVLNRALDAGDDPSRAAEVRFTRFFHNTPMAIATVDKAGRIARTNAVFARLFHSALRGEGGGSENRLIQAVATEHDRPALAAAIQKAADGQGDIPPVDAALIGADQRWMRFYVTPIEEEERDHEAAIVYALETTEQRSLQNQFTQSQKLETVGKFAGGIAHDFNNVLSAIMMATDFLLNAHRPTDPSFQDIMQIKQNANRAASLVRQLLAFSRRQTLRPEVLDLGEALSDLTMLLRRLLGEKVALDVVHGRDLWQVEVDISQFEQVIVNLVVNARDAMPEGGKLTVRTANVMAADCARYSYDGMPPADYVLIEVADSGTGIAPDILDKIFEPFFSTKDVGKGTGLGLSTVYGIIKQTGGFIYVDSVLGKGTTFRIFLPRHVSRVEDMRGAGAESTAELETAAVEAAATDRAALAATDLTGHGTILLVEDEDGLRALNARGLASRGYTVLQAANGVEAIEVLEEHDGQVDLVVSDVVMPEMDGPTLLKELRQRKPELKIIFVSGYAEDAFEKNLPERGQFAFLPKPFTLKQLVAAVKQTMTN